MYAGQLTKREQRIVQSELQELLSPKVRRVAFKVASRQPRFRMTAAWVHRVAMQPEVEVQGG